MALFICTGGTSIAEGGPLRRGESRDEFQARIVRKITAARAGADGDPFGMLVKLSAETHALARADCGPNDEVLVLASDTLDGLAAAEAVVRVVAEMLGAKGRVRSIEGLQVSEANRFRQSGIRNLIEVVLREIGAARAGGTDRVVFNVTGGFKGVMPYLTMLGMLNEIETIYVYDNSEVLIRLPPLPMRFDHDRIAFALPALRILQKEIIEEEKFLRLLPGRGFNDDTIFKDLIERADGFVTLSAAGEMALRGLITGRKTYTVNLHRNARRSSMLDHEKAVHALGQMTVPESFLIPTHSWEIPDKSDMLIWKTPMGPASPRLFYWVEDDVVRVAEILHHEVYEREVIHGDRRIRRKDYAAEDFSPFVGKASTADPQGDALSAWISELDDEQTAQQEHAATRERELKEAQRRLADANRQRRQLQERLDIRERELSALQAAYDRLQVQAPGEDCEK
jgi:putative CRISPR-associated protein (TIGR02619 family)